MRCSPFLTLVLSLATCAVAPFAFGARPSYGPAGARSAFPTAPTFVADLSSRQEAPPLQSQAGGEAMFFLSRDGNALRYVVTVDRLRDVTMAHLHLAAAGKNGPVVAWLYPKSPPPRVRKGEISGTLSSGVLAAADLRGPLQGKSLRDLVDAVKAGDIYVQVHTEQHPEGEIRGEAAMASPAP